MGKPKIVNGYHLFDMKTKKEDKTKTFSSFHEAMVHIQQTGNMDLKPQWDGEGLPDNMKKRLGNKFEEGQLKARQEIENAYYPRFKTKG